MESTELKTPNKQATGIAVIPTKNLNIRVSNRILELAKEKAELYKNGMNDVIREALYYFLNDNSVPYGFISPDIEIEQKPLISIIPDPDDIQNRNANIDATVSLDVKFFFRDLSNKTGVLEGELLGELARKYTMNEMALAESTPESPILKIDVTHDDLRIVDTVFAETDTTNYADFIKDVLILGLEQKQKELSTQINTNEFVFDEKEPEEEEKEPEENETSEVYKLKQENAIKRMSNYFINHGIDEIMAIDMAKEWVDKYQEEVVMSFCFYDVDNIIDDDVFIDIVENGFNEDKYMTLKRETEAERKFKAFLEKEINKKADEYQMKAITLEAEAKEGEKSRKDLTIFVNKTRELIGFYEESTSLKGMFTKYSKKQLIEMYPEEYRKLLA